MERIPWKLQQSTYKKKVNEKRKFRRERQEAKHKVEGTSGRTASKSQLRVCDGSPSKNGPHEIDEEPRSEKGQDSWAPAQSPGTFDRERSRRPRDTRSQDCSRSRPERRNP